MLAGDSVKTGKSGQIEAALMNTLLPVSKAELCGMFPEISTSTVEMTLARLLKEDKIRKIGGSKNTKYVPKQDIMKE